MQRWTAIVFVGLVAMVIAVVMFRTGPRVASGDGRSLSATSASSTGLPERTSPAGLPRSPSLGAPTDLSAPRLTEGRDAGLDLEDLAGVEPGGEDAGGQLLPNGQPAPSLPADGPKSVTFGAALIEYRGAQGATTGARSKEEALSLAKHLAELAKTDFKAAVSQGDKGSSEDFGALPRGILEPGPEFVLFGLAVGDTSEPVDSPRGFYVFKRIE